MFPKSIAITSGLLLLYLIGNPAVLSLLGSKAAQVIDPLRKERLSERDEALIESGYYQNLISVDRFNTQLWERYSKPADWRHLERTGAVRRRTGDFLEHELVPSAEVRFHGAILKTNRWGMRDKDYDLTKPLHTFRIALLGSSMEMGWGVENDQIFESLLEERLNREATGMPYGRYEILNFAVHGYEPLDQVAVLETKVLLFKPDAIFYVAHPGDPARASHSLADKVQKKVHIPYAYLREVVSKAEIGSETQKDVATRHLRSFSSEMLFWSYRQIVEQCRKRGITPVWILAPRAAAGEVSKKENNAQLIRLATDAGFEVLDLTDIFDGYDLEKLKLATWDAHPNARGHRLVAERLYSAIREKEALKVRLALGSSMPR